jgi:hypothetical protein
MSNGGQAPVELHVAFREGFDGDRVVIEVDGQRIERDGLTTRTQIGLAGDVDLSVPPGSRTAHVSLPDRGIEQTGTHDLDGETWLGVDVVGGGVELEWSTREFWYA